MMTDGKHSKIFSMSDKWIKVIHAADCIYEDWDEDHECPVCPNCHIDYAECPCPGPTQDEEYDYKLIKGELYAKKK